MTLNLQNRWGEAVALQALRRRNVDRRSGEQLSKEPYVLWQVITHDSYHGMQHRSEAAMLLSHFGHSPGNIDMVFWLDERK